MIRTDKKGFTLMELLIVIAILGILGVAFVPNILKAPAKARDAVRVKKVQDVHTAIEAYYAEKGKLPDAAGDPCLTDAIATQIGMQAAPIDSNQKGSCTGGVAGANDNLYMYHVYNDAQGKHYIVGALMEVPTAANTTLAKNGVAALAAPPASVSNDANGTFFVANGPI